MLPANGKDQPLLQGWAIVDNTVGEDWTNVELSLVAGAPQSFIQQLSQAYYGRRAVVPLPQYAQLAPQTHEGAMLGGSASPDAATDTLQTNENGLAFVKKSGVAGGAGEPPQSATIGAPLSALLASPRNAAAPNPYAIAAARGAGSAAAQANDLGDLFEYKLKDRVTIHKNESALVPIVQVPVTAEKVSLWNSSLSSPRPLRALWLTNSSALTLDEGSFSVIEDEAFAGEGLIDAIKPEEKRLISYAVDLGVRVDRKSESQPQRVTRVRISRGVMIQTSETHQETSYTIRNDRYYAAVGAYRAPAASRLADLGADSQARGDNIERLPLPPSRRSKSHGEI